MAALRRLVAIPKGYIYFPMAFAIGVEMLNMRMRKRVKEPVHLWRRAQVEQQIDA
ncbi:MAG: hypothetical protein ACXWUK_10485 [Burkholderiales bacterium]